VNISPSDFGNYLLLAFAAFGAGGMNAIAGGGSLLTFPALVFTGVPAVVANASSTVALFPGALASAWGYRKDFTSFQGVSFPSILVVSFVGGAVGAVLLLSTPESTFDIIVPWLLLAATLVFIFASKVWWTQSLVMLAGAVAGGYIGARFGRKLDPRIVHSVVITISVIATIVFFLRKT
jgi:uncharacterized membrane protein YfcA